MHRAASLSKRLLGAERVKMDLCGHRGFAGPSACILEAGHDGRHKYGDIATAYEVEMRKDAERYRWLRQYGNHEWDRVFDEACRHMLEGAALDRAIDTALDKTPNASLSGGRRPSA